jgi:hypothetical protein
MGSALNERTAPRLSAPKTSTSPIPPGSVVAITELAQADGYLWGREALGWFAMRQGTTWWVSVVESNREWCRELPGWPVDSEPPVLVRGSPGVWVGPGANRDELLAYGAQLKAAGYQPAAVVYGDNTTRDLLLSHGWLVAVRAANVPDCPDTALPPETSAAQFLARVVAVTGTRAQWIIAANECGWPSAEYAASWIAAAGRIAPAFGIRALVPVVWNAGAPELSWLPVLAPAYRAAPVALAWGMNVYPVHSGVGLSVRSAYTQWTTWRYELYRDQLRGVPLVITEYARGDGSEPPDWQDIRLWWYQVRDHVLWSAAWYTATPLGQWAAANLRGRLGELVRAVL